MAVGQIGAEIGQKGPQPPNAFSQAQDVSQWAVEPQEDDAATELELCGEVVARAQHTEPGLKAAGIQLIQEVDDDALGTPRRKLWQDMHDAKCAPSRRSRRMAAEPCPVQSVRVRILTCRDSHYEPVTVSW